MLQKYNKQAWEPNSGKQLSLGGRWNQKEQKNASVTRVERVQVYKHKGHLYLLALFIKSKGGNTYVNSVE